MSNSNRNPEILKFLDALFGTKPEETFILIWQLANKESHWYRDVNEAARLSERRADKDLYVGVGLSDRDYGRHRRCPARDIAGIVGLWADIDIGGDGHQKSNLPPSIEVARTLLPAEMPPTILVNSGGGLHAWWLFKEPYMFDDDRDRQRAATAAQGWNAMLREVARNQGYDLDSVCDLSRVLRIAGTTNTKIPGQPRRATIVEQIESRYNLSDCEEWLDDRGIEAPCHSPVVPPAGASKHFLLNPNATPPFERFERLLELEPKFRLSWQHARGDLQDQSGSGYDMSLSYYAARYGWEPQEIVDLLIAHRRKHSLPEKLRPDYLERTVRRAQEQAEKYLSGESATERSIALLTQTDTEKPDFETIKETVK